MIERLREMGILPTEEENADGDFEEPRFRALRILAAELFLASGVHALLQYWHERGHTAPGEGEFAEPGGGSSPPYRPQATVWASALVAPAAGVAQLVHTLRPSESSHTATRILNGAVLGLGVAGLAESLYASRTRNERFSLGPLLFGYVGALGFLLDREEAKVAAEQEELEQRARIVERWVPRRRPKLDRIVVHV